MSTEGSVAIDLGALLRESISDGFAPSAAESGHMPVQLAPVHPQSVTARVPTPGEFKVVPMPTVAQSFSPQPVPTLAPESVRGFAMDITPAPVANVAKKSRGGLVGMVLGAVALASLMGGGAAFYMHRHDANGAKLAAAAAPPAAVTEAAPIEKAAMPALVRNAEPPAEAKVEEPAKVETTAAAAPAEEPAVEAKAKTTKHHRTAKVETAAAPAKAELKPVVEAPKPVAKVEKPVVEKPAKAEVAAKAEPKAAPAPPPPLPGYCFSQ